MGRRERLSSRRDSIHAQDIMVLGVDMFFFVGVFWSFVFTYGVHGRVVYDRRGYPV